MYFQTWFSIPRVVSQRLHVLLLWLSSIVVTALRLLKSAVRKYIRPRINRRLYNGIFRASANSVYRASSRGEGPGNEAKRGPSRANEHCTTDEIDSWDSGSEKRPVSGKWALHNRWDWPMRLWIGERPVSGKWALQNRGLTHETPNQRGPSLANEPHATEETDPWDSVSERGTSRASEPCATEETDPWNSGSERGPSRASEPCATNCMISSSSSSSFMSSCSLSLITPLNMLNWLVLIKLFFCSAWHPCRSTFHWGLVPLALAPAGLTSCLASESLWNVFLYPSDIFGHTPQCWACHPVFPSHILTWMAGQYRSVWPHSTLKLPIHFSSTEVWGLQALYDLHCQLTARQYLEYILTT